MLDKSARQTIKPILVSELACGCFRGPHLQSELREDRSTTATPDLHHCSCLRHPQVNPKLLRRPWASGFEEEELGLGLSGWRVEGRVTCKRWDATAHPSQRWRHTTPRRDGAEIVNHHVCMPVCICTIMYLLRRRLLLQPCLGRGLHREQEASGRQFTLCTSTPANHAGKSGALQRVSTLLSQLASVVRSSPLPSLPPPVCPSVRLFFQPYSLPLSWQASLLARP